MEPLGSGIVLDDRRILTCAHVIAGLPEADGVPVVWVAFPKAGEDVSASVRRQVKRIILPDARTPVKDLTILVLAKPVPADVTPAPLRCPRPTDLVSKRWRAFGFPVGDPLGSSASGHVESALAHGWVRLGKSSDYPVARGFSGSGLWSADYDAVVAVVAQPTTSPAMAAPSPCTRLTSGSKVNTSDFWPNEAGRLMPTPLPGSTVRSSIAASS